MTFEENFETVRAALNQLPRDILTEPFPENPNIQEMKAIRSFTQYSAEEALYAIRSEYLSLRKSHECCWHDGHGHGALGDCAETERRKALESR